MTDVERLADAVADRLADRLSPPDQLYTVKGAADLLAMSERSVREMIGAGTLGSVKIGGARKVPAAAIRRLTEEGDG